MKIDVNKVVTLTYELKVENEIVETIDPSKPFTFIYGTGNLLPKFEENIAGLVVGDEFMFDLKCDDAYGQASEDNVVELPKNIFEVEGEIDDNIVKEGSVVPMLDAEGRKHYGVIMEVQEGIVVMDFNHPMAGDDLSYTGKIIDIREATAEEMSHGHVHAAAASSCGCGSSSEGCSPESDSCGTDSQGGGCGCGC